MRYLTILLAIALVGCASKPKPGALTTAITGAGGRAQGAGTAVAGATEATASTGNAIKDAQINNANIERLLEELAK